MSPQLLFTISKEIKFSSQILYGKRMSWLWISHPVNKNNQNSSWTEKEKKKYADG